MTAEGRAGDEKVNCFLDVAARPRTVLAGSRPCRQAGLSSTPVDGFALALVAATALLLAVALLLFFRLRRLAEAVDGAARRIGVERPRRTSRPDALVAGLDRIDSYVAQAERDRTQLLAAIEAADIGIMATDDAGVVAFVNEMGQRYIGARHGEALAEARLREVLDEVMLTRESATQELDLYTPVRRVLRLRAVPVERGVESLGAVLFIEDLTEQRRVDAVRRDFVANVSHELKTPLGALALLAETLGDTEDEAVRARLSDKLAAEAKRMASLVTDLLDLSQVESYGVPPEPVPVDAIIHDALGQVRVAAEELGVKLVVEPLPNDAAVPGDRRQLVTAVANLVDNAVKYTEAKGEDSGGTVRVRASAGDEHVEIDVEDDGIGIPEGHLSRIFERFYRVDRARGREGGGTGLGLSIVRHIVLNHGGEIAVTSEEGSGSTFTMRLPRWKG